MWFQNHIPCLKKSKMNIASGKYLKILHVKSNLHNSEMPPPFTPSFPNKKSYLQQRCSSFRRFVRGAEILEQSSAWISNFVQTLGHCVYSISVWSWTHLPHFGEAKRPFLGGGGALGKILSIKNKSKIIDTFWCLTF